MAEPSPKRRSALAEVFLPNYNAVHATGFSNPPSAETAADDFTWTTHASPTLVLIAHHTVGAVDGASDYAQPKAMAKLNQKIQEWAKHNVPRGYAIHLGLPAVARSPSAEQLVTAELEKLVSMSLLAGQRVSRRVPLTRRASRDPDIDSVTLDVHRIGDDVRSVVWASGDAFVLVSVPRLREAIDRKQERLYGRSTTALLLVDFDVDGYEEEDVADLRAEAARTTVLYREVWGVSLFSPGERADRLWP